LVLHATYHGLAHYWPESVGPGRYTTGYYL